MPRHWIIDGNNLLFAIRAHGAAGDIGRETMLRILERWAGGTDDAVTLILDGVAPAGGLGRQLTSVRIHVEFSGQRTADDRIIDLIHQAIDPGGVRVVSADSAIIYEARRKRCVDVSSLDFARQLFPSFPHEKRPASPDAEKPHSIGQDDPEQVLRMMNAENLELFDDRELFENPHGDSQ